MKSEEELREDVIEEIRWDRQLAGIAAQIGVGVNSEVVTLSGVVDTYAQKLAAEKAALRVKGVKVVAVDIELKDLDNKTDTQIGVAIRNALTSHTDVKQDDIDIKVDNGRVYISGIVTWDYERKSTEKAIKKIIGVKGVTNQIKVKNSTVEPKEIRKKITAAFHRNATVDAENITIEVQGDIVTLSGKVRSWAEREDAEDVAWSMPGVAEVLNNLVIDTGVYANDL